jgi:excisionase family DNA binding protein
MDQDFYTINEFAEKLRVSHQTIRRAIRKGRINAFRVGCTEKSAIRIAHSEINRLGVVDLQKLIKQLILDGKNDLVKE